MKDVFDRSSPPSVLFRSEKDGTLAYFSETSYVPRVGETVRLPLGGISHGAPFTVLAVDTGYTTEGGPVVTITVEQAGLSDLSDLSALTDEELYDARMDCYYAMEVTLETDLWAGNAAGGQAHAAISIRKDLHRMEQFDREILVRKQVNNA